MKVSAERVSFSALGTSDLCIDAVYEGGPYKNVKNDPLARLLPVGNQGGFRYKKSSNGVLLCALYSTLVDPEWPDSIDVETGRFTYYGDNKKPGRSLHDTRRHGNLLLREMFDAIHSDRRDTVPPIFLFTRAGKSWDVAFRGLAVPGAPGLSASDDLVAVWKSRDGQRFQNYRASFTILSESVISRAWLTAVVQGQPVSKGAPSTWMEWRLHGVYRALQAESAIRHRTRREQLPGNTGDLRILSAIVDFFDDHPSGKYAFEPCALAISRMMLGGIVSADLTRPWRDGGRDATGKYRIGDGRSSILVDFALEAKCQQPTERNSSGVRQTSRLISRLRHRQFGIFVTTSCLHEQAYQELVDDEHPVVVIAGCDIVLALRRADIKTVKEVRGWLGRNFSEDRRFGL